MDGDNPKTILLVEDEAIIAMYEKTILEKHGFSVITVLNGETAIETTNNTPEINLILMDINLGRGMDGTEAAKKILEKHDLPLIFLSSHTERAVVEKTEGITSYGYIVKDSGEMTLIASIKMAFKLYESNKRLSDTFTYSINGLCIHKMLYDENGTPFDCEYIKVNKSYETYTGLTSQVVIGQTIRDIYPDGEADEVIDLYIDILATGIPAQKEVYFASIQRWFELSIFPTKKDEFTVAIQNITDRKQAEEARRESESLYASLVNSLPQNLYRIDLEGRITFVNQSLIESIGVPETEILGKTAYDFYPLELAQKYRRDDQEIVVSGQPLRLIEENIEPITGRRIFVDVIKIPIFADDGRVVGIQGVFEDVTDRRQAETALQESEEKYRTLFERVGDAIFMYDPDTLEILEANEATSKLYGYDRAELIGMSGLKFSAEVDESKRVVEEIAETGQRMVPIRHHQKKDGSDIYVHLTGYKMRLNERDVMFIVCTDITERKLVEDALRESEKQIRLITDNIPAYVALVDLENLTYQFVNQRYVDAYTQSREQIIGAHVKEIVGRSNYEFALPYINSVRMGKTVSYENSFVTSEGTRWVNVNYIPNMTYDGDIVGIIVLSFDITERKQAEEAEREREILYHQMFSRHSATKLLIDPDTGVIIEANQAASQFYGYPLDVLQQMKIDEINTLDPEEIAVLREEARIRKANYFIFPHRLSTGEIRYVEVHSTPIQMKGRTLLYSIIHDVTERKQAEEAVERGHTLLTGILEALPVGVCLTDETGHYRMMNAAYCAIYEYDREEMIGQHYSVIMPPDQIAVVNAQYARLLSGDTGIPSERKRQRKNGRYIYIEAANALVENVDGKKMVITTVRDITERKQTSEEIAALLQEKELLLKETHHRIKNNMMVVSSLLSLQMADGNIESEQRYKAILNNAIRQVRSMMILYDKLYRSENFRDLNIRTFLPPLVDEIMAVFHAVPSIRAEVQVDDFILSAKILATLGIIINEMISNSMKHAFKGCDNGVICITASKTDSLVRIEYEDDGIGFAETISSGDSAGFGMRLIAILIQQLDGSIQTEGESGMKFVITFEA